MIFKLRLLTMAPLSFCFSMHISPEALQGFIWTVLGFVGQGDGREHKEMITFRKYSYIVPLCPKSF